MREETILGIYAGTVALLKFASLPTILALILLGFLRMAQAGASGPEAEICRDRPDNRGFGGGGAETSLLAASIREYLNVPIVGSVILRFLQALSSAALSSLTRHRPEAASPFPETLQQFYKVVEDVG
jgi:hypothetical protein